MRAARALFVAALLLSGIACSRSSERVARLAASKDELRLPYPGFESLTLELTPKSALPPGAEPQLFLHLLDEPGSVIRTFDQSVGGGWTPERTKQIFARIYQSALGDPLDAGSYMLTAGLYDRRGGRFALETDAKEVARFEYAIATVTVPAAGDSLPALRFSDGWLPATPGKDRQVLARRSLDGRGPATFQIGPLTPPGQILLRIAPAPSGAVRTEIGGDGAGGGAGDTVRVHLRSSCGGYEGEIPGDVSVETLIDVPEAAAPVTCDVELAPNFVLRSDEDGKARSVAIEVLAWRSGPPEG